MAPVEAPVSARINASAAKFPGEIRRGFFANDDSVDRRGPAELLSRDVIDVVRIIGVGPPGVRIGFLDHFLANVIATDHLQGTIMRVSYSATLRARC
jgi:hypothetical protein